MACTLKLPVGIDSFEKIRRNKFYYIDKTKLIEQLVETGGEVTLFTRPRRFGKTLNMSMLKAFFETGADAESNKLIPLYEEIYFDKSAQIIRIHINYPEAENVKIRIADIQGALLTELSLSNVTLLDKNIKASTNGVYIVAIESENYRLNRKIFVNN